MRTVGEILKNERQKKNFSLEQVERSTKIRAKFLLAIEEDGYHKLPPSPYVEGFLKNYCEFLGLRSETILAIFRRQASRQPKNTGLRVEEPLTESRWHITPNKVIMFSVAALLIILFGYFYTQYRALHAPPPLKISHPDENFITRDMQVAVYGDTDKDAVLTINGEPALVKDDGRFYQDVDLNLGNNTLVIEVTSRAGEKSVQSRQVVRLENKD